LLCACSCANPGPEHLARISQLIAAASDWDDLLPLAEYHGVLPLVARNLTDHAGALPPHIAHALRSAYAANLRRNLWFAAELQRILRHFAQKNVRALPYKGPVLAQSAYGDLALRTFSDLDLLISPNDFARAKQSLAELGYRPSKPFTPAVERLWLRTGYERSFDGPAGKNLVEVQWSLLPRFYAVDARAADFAFDDLLARSGRIALGSPGTRAPRAHSVPADSAPVDPARSHLEPHIPCLSPEDSLLVLCLHAAKHLWTRLIWVADIAESLRTPNLDVSQVITRAHGLGISRILGLSFWLAKNLLGARLPEGAHELLTGDPAIPPLGQACAARLARCGTYDFESAEYFRQTLHLRERSRDRWRYIWRLASTPGSGDIDAVALPEALFPLYRAIRLARLLGKLQDSRLPHGPAPT
jgi:hypothetical protein